jgi:hypothetical protein
MNFFCGCIVERILRTMVEMRSQNCGSVGALDSR